MSTIYWQNITLAASSLKTVIEAIISTKEGSLITFFDEETYEIIPANKLFSLLHDIINGKTFRIRYLDTYAFFYIKHNGSFISIELHNHSYVWEKKYHQSFNYIDNARYMRLLLDITENHTVIACKFSNDDIEEFTLPNPQHCLIVRLYATEKDYMSSILINAWENNIQLFQKEEISTQNNIQNFDNTELEFASYGTYSCYATWKNMLAQIIINTNNIILIPLDVNTKTPLLNTSIFDLRQYTKMLLLLCENFGILEMYCYTENEE